MSDTTADPIVLTAEQIAEHLSWRLSNSNAELDLPGAFVDVAFDTSRDGTEVVLSVNSWDAATGRRGHQLFVLAVSPSEPGGQG